MVQTLVGDTLPSHHFQRSAQKRHYQGTQPNQPPCAALSTGQHKSKHGQDKHQSAEGQISWGNAQRKAHKEEWEQIDPEQDSQQGQLVDGDLLHGCAANVQSERREAAAAGVRIRTERDGCLPFAQLCGLARAPCFALYDAR